MSAALERILLDHSSGILLLVEPSTLAIREMSKSSLRLLGYRREELLGRPITDIESSLAGIAFWDEVLQGRPAAARNAACSYRCAGGELLPATKTVSHIADGDKGWLVVRAEPLDCGRCVEEQMASVASLLRATLEATADGILLTDRAGGIINMNQRFARMWGLPHELLAVRDDGAIFDFMAGLFSDPNAYLAASAQIEPDSDEETYDLLHLADGRAFERKSIPARQGARIVGRVFSFTDVSARKQMEDALRISEEQFRKAFDVSPDAININRLHDGLYVSVNSGFARIMGYSRDDIVGHTSTELNIWDDAEDRTRLVQALTKDGAVENLEAKFRTKDGLIRIGLMSAAAIEIGGVPHAISVTRDITEHKQAERERALLEMQLRESQKMEALGTLAGGIAHDFNNIITAITGNAELALDDVGPAHASRDSLKEILKASRRAKDLVQQILAFGRRQLIERRVISLAPTVVESARLLRATLPAGISLSVACAPDAPPVLADATQIEQVLLNLCTNAWQVMHGQSRPGVIEIRLETRLVVGAAHKGPEQRSNGGRTALRPGRYACLTVRDNGPGMDETTRERMFEPFFTTKPAGMGTGLGLAVVHGIVQEHGASIAVQSAPGEGSTFRIYFPASSQSADPVQEACITRSQDPATRALQGEGRSILYVDDDESIVLLMSRLLERQGYRVSGHTDPHAALAEVRAQPDAFDLVVTDYNMPGLSGLEVARALQELRSDLPVALASGYITEELRADAPAAGIRELIYKPNTADELCAAVARLLRARHGGENSS